MAWDGKTERRIATMQCQQEILDRLTKIEVEFSLCRRAVEEINRAINGNSKPGFVVDLTKTRENLKLVNFLLTTAWVAIIGLIVRRWM